MNTLLAFGYLICALFGIALNVTVIFFIIVRRRLRRLRRQPRNIIWIAISFSDVFFVCCNLLDAIGYYLPEATEMLCLVRFFFAGFPGTTFLMYNFLSLVGLYLSNFHPGFYRRRVTVRLVIDIQLAASSFYSY